MQNNAAQTLPDPDLRVASFDLETYSEVDLAAAGAEIYFKHDSTWIWCLAYAIGDALPAVWHPGNPIPTDLAAHVEAGGLMSGWNVTFDALGWNSILVPKFGFPLLRDDQLIDTQAQALAAGLPAKLKECAEMFSPENQKDEEGASLMKRLSKPAKTGNRPCPTPDERTGLFAYCVQDVVVERELSRQLSQLPDVEQQVWLWHKRMNDRGVRIDRESARLAVRINRTAAEERDRHIAALTGNAVTKATQVGRMKSWLRDTHGVDLTSLGKDTQLTASAPPAAHELIKLRQEGNRTSVSKYEAMLRRSEVNGRAYGQFQYCGANRTGRTSATGGIQLQNMPRQAYSETEVERIKQLMRAGGYAALKAEYNDVALCLSRLSRSMIIPAPGHVFVDYDFSAIEVRVLSWLLENEYELDLFRESDSNPNNQQDIYCDTYARAFDIPVEQVTKGQRTLGKIMRLSLQYGSGAQRLATSAREYGIELCEDEAEHLKNIWRSSNPDITGAWDRLSNAAKRAVSNRNEAFEFARCAYFKEDNWLICVLPSGRCLRYLNPDLTPGLYDATELYFTRRPQVPQEGGYHADESLYHGRLINHITQGTARDIMVDAALRIEKAGIPLVLTVHDQLVAEVPESDAADTERTMKEIMCAPPDWAADLPLNAEGGIRRCFGK